MTTRHSGKTSAGATVTNLKRRRLLKGIAATGGMTLLNGLIPNYARGLGALTAPGARNSQAVTMDIAIERQTLDIAGKTASALTLNNTIPGPLVELYEGEEATLRVENRLSEESSIHWHGLILPFEMDGVPGVAFPGIAAGDTFEAKFPARQYGTYWYHSHSGVQEQSGVYGPLVIHPKDPEPYTYQRDYVVMLSDWTFEDPHQLMLQLKKMSDYYNYQRQTAADLFSDAKRQGLGPTLSERLAWNRMRMLASDIADVTGATYTYLMNGLHPAGNWTGTFAEGDKIRLRFINASAMTYFNVRIPQLPMTVVQADGQNVEPIETDEFQMGPAETLDVIVSPTDLQAYTIMAESMDRSGYARGTLAPQMGMSAAIPSLRARPLRTMMDMGMDMSTMDMGAMNMDMNPNMDMDTNASGDMTDSTAASAHDHSAMPEPDPHAGHNPPPEPAPHAGHNPAPEPDPHAGHMQQSGTMAGMAEPAVPATNRHGPDKHGPGNTSVAQIQRNRLSEPGTGLENVGHRVLTYADLRNIMPTQDTREPSTTVEIHLTGNMERYMWSFDGKEFKQVESTIHFPYGERIRLILVNDTMMEHPIHLHGMFMELENGQGSHLPFKHTISVKPAERLSLLITANETGRWAFHCHLLYHMEVGMFRVVEVK